MPVTEFRMSGIASKQVIVTELFPMWSCFGYNVVSSDMVGLICSIASSSSVVLRMLHVCAVCGQLPVFNVGSQPHSSSYGLCSPLCCNGIPVFI